MISLASYKPFPSSATLVNKTLSVPHRLAKGKVRARQPVEPAEESCCPRTGLVCHTLYLQCFSSWTKLQHQASKFFIYLWWIFLLDPIYASTLKTRMEKSYLEILITCSYILFGLKKESICITRTWSGKVIPHRRIHMNIVRQKRRATCGINQYQVQNCFFNISVCMKVFIRLF